MDYKNQKRITVDKGVTNLEMDTATNGWISIAQFKFDADATGVISIQIKRGSDLLTVATTTLSSKSDAIWQGNTFLNSGDILRINNESDQDAICYLTVTYEMHNDGSWEAFQVSAVEESSSSTSSSSSSSSEGYSESSLSSDSSSSESSSSSSYGYSSSSSSSSAPEPEYVVSGTLSPDATGNYFEDGVSGGYTKYSEPGGRFTIEGIQNGPDAVNDVLWDILDANDVDSYWRANENHATPLGVYSPAGGNMPSGDATVDRP